MVVAMLLGLPGYDQEKFVYRFPGYSSLAWSGWGLSGLGRSFIKGFLAHRPAFLSFE